MAMMDATRFVEMYKIGEQTKSRGYLMDLRVHVERIDRNTSTFNGNVAKSSHVICIHFARRQMFKEAMAKK